MLSRLRAERVVPWDGTGGPTGVPDSPLRRALLTHALWQQPLGEITLREKVSAEASALAGSSTRQARTALTQCYEHIIKPVGSASREGVLVVWRTLNHPDSNKVWYTSAWRFASRVVNLTNLMRPESGSVCCTLAIEAFSILRPLSWSPVALGLYWLWTSLGAVRCWLEPPHLPASNSLLARIIRRGHVTTGYATIAAILIAEPNYGYWVSGTFWGAILGVCAVAAVRTQRSVVVETLPNPCSPIINYRDHPKIEDLASAHTTSRSLTGFHQCTEDCPDLCATRVPVELDPTDVPPGRYPYIIRGDHAQPPKFGPKMAVKYVSYGAYTVVDRLPGKHIFYTPSISSNHADADVNVEGEDVVINGPHGTDRVPIHILSNVAYCLANVPRATEEERSKFRSSLRSMFRAQVGAERITVRHPEVCAMIVGQMVDHYSWRFNHDTVRSDGSQPTWLRRMWMIATDTPRGWSFDWVCSWLVRSSSVIQRYTAWKYVVTPVPQYTMIIKPRATGVSYSLDRKPTGPFRDEGARSVTTLDDCDERDSDSESGEHDRFPGDARPEPRARPKPSAPPPPPDHGHTPASVADDAGRPPAGSEQHDAVATACVLYRNPQPPTDSRPEEVREPSEPDIYCCGACRGERNQDEGNCRCDPCLRTSSGYRWRGRCLSVGDIIHYTHAGSGPNGTRFITCTVSNERRDIRVSVDTGKTWRFDLSYNDFISSGHHYLRLDATLLSIDEMARPPRGRIPRGEWCNLLSEPCYPGSVPIGEYCRDVPKEGLWSACCTGKPTYGPYIRILGPAGDVLVEGGAQTDAVREVGEEVPTSETRTTAESVSQPSRKSRNKRQPGRKLPKGRNHGKSNGSEKHQSAKR